MTHYFVRVVEAVIRPVTFPAGGNAASVVTEHVAWRGRGRGLAAALRLGIDIMWFRVSGDEEKECVESHGEEEEEVCGA